MKRANAGCHIMVNQAGYLPDSKKIGVITMAAERFQVKDTQGGLCLQGEVTHFGLDEASGDDIYMADFSALRQEGSYVLQVDNQETSLPFSVGQDVYDDACHKLQEAYYYLKCGGALTGERAGRYAHGICHNRDAVLWEDPSVSKDVTGGWHDAGDYGKYVTAGACAVSHLLYAWQLFPDGFEETEGEMPELLKQCRIELEWMLKMQREDGGVYHKVTTKEHAPFIMPDEDQEQLYIFAVSTTATADFCAVCAQAASVYQKWDSAWADGLKQAARRAADFLQSHPEHIRFINPEGNHTGDYTEEDDTDNRFWASAQMYALTGESEYHTQVHQYMDAEIDFTALGCYSMGGLGAMAYLFCEREDRDPQICQRLQEHIIHAAEQLAQSADRSGYGAAMEMWHYSWGSNMELLKHGMLFVLADLLEQGDRFAKYATDQWHVLLGVNAMGYSYVTGVGARAINHPHYRPSYADGIEESVPGLVAGGPNGHPCDPVATAAIPAGTPPMKCYVDDFASYSLNEVTIYWNSPAVFLGAYLRHTC